MSRSVHQILRLLGAADPAALRLHPLPGTGEVWGADYGSVTTSLSLVEKQLLLAAGASEEHSPPQSPPPLAD